MSKETVETENTYLIITLSFWMSHDTVNNILQCVFLSEYKQQQQNPSGLIHAI